MGVIVGLILAALAAVALLILGVWTVVWNVTDIQNVGINFWNTFWLVLVALGVVAAASRG